MIPKERLDEVLARAKAAEQHLSFTQQQLQQVLQAQRPQQPVQTDPEMEKIKESNPSLYRRLLKAENDGRQVRAAFFGISDKTDRMEFLQTFGDKGKKRLDEVERMLSEARNANNFNVNRGSIYQHILGQEKLREEMNPKTTPVATTTTAATDAPSSDAASVAPINSSKAGGDFSKLSREDQVKALENIEF